MRENRKNRTYHRKLTVTFAFIAIVVSITVIAAGFLIERNLRASVLHTKESLEEVSSHVAESSIMEASGAIDALSTSSILSDWASSDVGSADYYYGALRIYNELRRLSPVNDMYSYRISITSANPEAFVITQDGTDNRLHFFSGLDSAYLSLEDLNGIYETRSGDRFVSILSRFIGNSTILVITEFPSHLFRIPDEGGIDVSVVDETRSAVVSCTDDAGTSIHGIPLSSIPIGTSDAGGYAFRREFFPYFRLSIIYSHYSGFVIPVMVFALFIPLIIIIAVIAAYALQKELYKPVKAAYESVKDDVDDGTVNEFDAIISRCREVDSLSRKLSETFEELHMASDMQKYRAYILGSDSPRRASDDESACFALAIIIDEEDKDEMNISHLLQIYSNASRIKHLHFILMDDGTGTLIYKGNDEDECYSYLYRCLRDYTAIDDLSTIQAAIAPPGIGWRSIRPLYAKAKEILGFRYIMRDKAILTSSDVSGRTDTMSYSVSDERKLVNAALAALPDTLSIFDDIVQSNSEKIMPESEFRQLVSALGSTILRVFQETKENDASAAVICIMNGNDSEHMLASLRKELSDYIDRKRNDDETKYSSTVAMMKEYIQKHYSEPLMLIDLSEEFNLSPKYCSEIFNRLSGDTFKNYLNRYRIECAQRILDSEPDTRISDLAVRVGFSSSNTFIRVFDKYMGVTPKQYAENIKKGR